jgi:bla regulator protein blaR1
LLCVTATFLDMQLDTRSSSAVPVMVARALRNAAPPDLLSDVPSVNAPVTDYLPLFVWAWLGGVIALTCRSLGGWAVASRFARKETRAAGAFWEERMAGLLQRLRISRPVKLAVSSIARVPAVVGWMKPVVLMPATALSGLTVEQIEGLLAHELAHVRRHDYAINLLQTAVETLLFYHPAVWWVSRSIRNERENCCDDLAVEICGNPATYVRALADLEQLCGDAPAFAMAANRGSLLDRVERLLRLNPHGTSAPSGLLAVIGITLVCVSVIGVEARGFARRQKPTAPAIAHTEASEAAAASEVEIPAEEPISPPEARAAVEIRQAQAAPPQQSNADQKPEDWLGQIDAAGFHGLSVDKLIELKIHGIDGKYIQEIRAAGFDPDINKLLELKIHGIDGEYIRQMRSTGFQFTADKLLEVRIHGITPQYIQEVRSLGYPDISVDKILEMKIHGVTSDFVREARQRFRDLTLDQIIQLKIFDILK